MNSLRPILAAMLLSLTISIPAVAGDVGTPAGNSGQPPRATCSTCDDQPSTTSTELTERSPTESVQTSQLAVDIILALLSVF
jgi:hypothetical protein